MKIAIDISPLNPNSQHKVRGVGFYLENLKEALIRNFKNHSFIFFTDKSEVPHDVSLVHYPYFDPFFLTLPLVPSHKTVVTVHDLTPIIFPHDFPPGLKGVIKWHVQRYALQKSAAIITDSHASKKDISIYTRISDNKIHTVYLAANNAFKKLSLHEQEQKELSRKYNLPSSFVLYVGDVTANKNLPRLIQACISQSLHLVLVGKSLSSTKYDATNPWNRDLRKVHQMIQNNMKIHTIGFVPTEDLVKLYNMATVFAMPSLYEGFGLPVLEAMQSGCPVVTTTNGSLQEIAGDASFFVDAYSVEDIGKGISQVFSSKKLQVQLSRAGIEQAKKFSWDTSARETVQVYENIIGKK